MKSAIISSLHEAQDALNALCADTAVIENIDKAAALLIASYESRGRVFSCGNGGSMCDAMHFAEELTGRYRKDRRALPATAISDPGHMSCVGNDMGYDEVFSRYIEAHGHRGDCLLALSTSGTSRNIIRAVEAAKVAGMQVIVLTGKPGSILEAHADVCICTPGGKFADRVQELHIKVLHILIELVERHFFPENYSAGSPE